MVLYHQRLTPEVVKLHCAPDRQKLYSQFNGKCFLSRTTSRFSPALLLFIPDYFHLLTLLLSFNPPHRLIFAVFSHPVWPPLTSLSLHPSLRSLFTPSALRSSILQFNLSPFFYLFPLLYSSNPASFSPSSLFCIPLFFPLSSDECKNRTGEALSPLTARRLISIFMRGS